MARAWYNEIDRRAAQWLRNLIADRQILDGDVDERSIEDVRPADLAGYDQHHFFAGIGGWPIALRLAGWPDARPVWTGSAPCQPFSAAGKGKAGNDRRHLWPAWLALIRERRPAIILGEQVEAAIGWGWLDVVFADLETQGYACGATVLPACCVGAPHIRNRIWFVADARHDDGTAWCARGEQQSEASVGAGIGSNRAARELADDDSEGCGQHGAQQGEGRDADRGGAARELGNTGGARREGREHEVAPRAPWQGGRSIGQPSGASDFWSNAEWLACSDGKARPIEPGSFPLAHGLRGRTHLLRAYGNAIVPQLAAQFIRAIS